MSLRASSPPPRPRPLARLAPPPARGTASSGRRALDEVLRAGRAVGPAPVAKPSSLTASLKAMQVTPTGAPCVPLSFDPDYCSADKFYAFGMAVVTTAVGALAAQGTLATYALTPLVNALGTMMDSRCSSSWFQWLTERTFETRDTLFSDTPFCVALARASNVARGMETTSAQISDVAQRVIWQLITVVFAPVIAYANTFGPAYQAGGEQRLPSRYPIYLGGAVMDNPLSRSLDPSQDLFASLETFNRERSKMQVLLAGINLQWVRMIRTKMNEMARGVASYMRVNFKQYLRNKTLYETNPIAFSRRILYDIVEDEAPASAGEPGSPGSPYTPGGTNHGSYTDMPGLEPRTPHGSSMDGYTEMGKSPGSHDASGQSRYGYVDDFKPRR